MTLGSDVYHFAGSPPTVVAFFPFALLPEDVMRIAGLAPSVASAAFILRRLRLPTWWLLFPPMVEGVVVANPHIWLLAPLVPGSDMAGAFAPLFKVYAVFPLLGERRWRAVALAAAVDAASVAVAPGLWADNFAEAGAITERLSHEAGLRYTVFDWGILPLTALVMIALVVVAALDLRAAGWLVVLAIWPATERSYTTFALPIVTTLLAIVLALPIRGLPSFVAVAR